MWVEEKTVCLATPCFNFTESPGILVNFSDDTLIQYFEYFFDDSMLELIVEETKVYAEQCFHSQKSKMHSKQREWRSTCRLSWKQYLPLKKARFGIKMYMLCEAKSGYVWSSIIFMGRGTLFDEEFLKPEFSKSMQVVLTLMKPLLNKGYCVTLDNYYSSPILTDPLVKYKTDSYGMISLNRKEVPSYVKSKKLKRGETIAFRCGKALILKWKDKKDVSLISNIHNSEMIAVRSSREEKLKPKIVVDYNDTMGGVDRADQNLACYLWHLSPWKMWEKFRLDLVNEMVIKYHSESMGSKRGRPLLKTPLRLTERHFVKFIPPTEKKAKPVRKCFICCRKRDSDGKKLRKETRYYCEKCDVGLCAVPCFEKFHTQSDIY
ncbi:piggyBac transposable element-derived protein 4 [Trichonephila clavipes]|nr:piggyBac transposable element-derived protein 4 [Trichonephila clavipes]